jgi:ubiquinone/menaquinone biosynthesis C-methylase UbiE
MAWVLLFTSAAAVLGTGLIATGIIVARIAPRSTPLEHPGFWAALLAACGLTLLSLGLRTLRWIFLLRRSEARIPIRDAYIAYLAGFSLLLAPLFLGEIAVRAYIHRRRARVPAGVTATLNVWERWLDVCALVFIASVISLWTDANAVAAGALFAVLIAMLPPARRLCLRAASSVASPIARAAGESAPSRLNRVAAGRTWAVTFSTSLLAWLLPGVGLWGLARAWEEAYTIPAAQLAFAKATLAGAAVLAPGGVVVAGGRLLAALGTAGGSVRAATLTVMGIRLATAGISTVTGLLFVALHFRSQPISADHFDEIADAYDVQIPVARRMALLTKKTTIMRDQLQQRSVGRRGLDVGCGQGWYVARMRDIGFDVVGIDASSGQIQLAAAHVGNPELVQVGSTLAIPAPDASYDFAYTINVLHHLPSIEAQRAAFVELLRVVQPGGLVFVHEINTRNILFRFYMGYVFPTLNCIDEGVERWLLPHQFDRYTDAEVVEVEYFTFMPEFLPASIIRLCSPLERRLERSTLRIYSAHYMVVLKKPT